MTLQEIRREIKTMAMTINTSPGLWSEDARIFTEEADRNGKLPTPKLSESQRKIAPESGNLAVKALLIASLNETSTVCHVYLSRGPANLIFHAFAQFLNNYARYFHLPIQLSPLSIIF